MPISVSRRPQMSVQIILETVGQKFPLPKDFLLSTMTNSILAQAIAGDPDAQEIRIPSADVTPRVMQALIELSQGKDPKVYHPDFLRADKYLNWPPLRAFGDPLYNSLDHKDMNAPRNRQVFEMALKTNPQLVYYLVSRGFDCTYQKGRVLLLAAAIENPEQLQFLLQRIPYMDEALMTAIDAKCSVNARVLFKAWPGRTRLHNFIRVAIASAQPEVLDMLLTDTRIDPKLDFTGFTRYAMNQAHIPTLQRVLKDERFTRGLNYATMVQWAQETKDPNIIYEIITALDSVGLVDDTDGYFAVLKLAIELKRTQLVEAILQKPKCRPNFAHMSAALRVSRPEMVKLLLACPKYDPTDAPLGLIIPAVNMCKKLSQTNDVGAYIASLTIVSLLLADGRIDPRHALQLPDLDDYPNMKAVLLGDPRCQ
jgi:hypothetical protein